MVEGFPDTQKARAESVFHGHPERKVLEIDGELAALGELVHILDPLAEKIPDGKCPLFQILAELPDLCPLQGDAGAVLGDRQIADQTSQQHAQKIGDKS